MNNLSNQSINLTPLLIFFLITFSFISAQDSNQDGRLAAQCELSIQNQTYLSIGVSLECLEMPYEQSEGCYFDEIIFFENFLEGVRPTLMEQTLGLQSKGKVHLGI